MINNFFIKNSYDMILCKKEIVMKLNITQKVKIIEDFRSAVFWSIGVKQVNNRKVLIIVDYDDLSNGYTAFTEAWFQRTEIHVIVLINPLQNIDFFYNRCFVNIFDFEEDKIIYSCPGPILIKLNYLKENQSINLKINNILKYSNEKNIKIICSKKFVFEEEVENEFSIFKIDCDYGIISTACGMSVASCENRIIVVCTSKQMMLDINIFNNRYIPYFFKIIVFGNIVSKDWLLSNDIDIYEIESIKDFWKSKKRSILFLKEYSNVY